MKNEYYSKENLKKINTKYVFVMQSRSLGKTLYEQKLRKAQELKECFKNEK